MPRKEKLCSPVPMRDGVSASRVWLPKQALGPWITVLDFLIERFPFLGEQILRERIKRGIIVDEAGSPITADMPYPPESFLFYYREIENEPRIPFEETILFRNERFVVVDKPHFVPVTPTGRFIRESLLARLKRRLQNEDISPMHRLDRETAGVMLFTCDVNVRSDYQLLFQKRKVKKTYQAITIAPDPARTIDFPLTYRSRMKKSHPFFTMRETAGEANTETRIKLLEIRGAKARFELQPLTGKQHQLRVHLMALGVPIINDPFYPELLPNKGEDYSQPLQLLAKSIAFTDPVSGEQHYFETQQELVL